MKEHFWYVATGIAAILIIVAIAHNKRQGDKTKITPVDTTTQKPPAKEMEGAFWEGRLEESNNPKKGNLMLVTDKTTVYINTSRDFSALLGKQVKVGYQGTLDSFKLGDIVVK